MKSILLTGSAGQVGSEITRQAHALLLPVHSLSRRELDIGDAAAVARAVEAVRPRIIVNAAAYTAVDRAEDEPAAAFRVNRDGAAHLAEAAHRAGIPMIHLSTDYVFDGTSERAYRTSDPAAPIGVYGQSKWEGEEAVRRRLAQHLIIRVSWVFGVYGHNFVKTILRLANERDELKVVADQVGGPTYAGHIAGLVLNLYRKFSDDQTVPWGTYHFSGAPATSWHAFAEAIIAAGRRHGLVNQAVKIIPIATEDYPTRARRPANSVLEVDDLAAAFGVTPPSWEEGLKEMLAQMAEEK